MFDHCDDDYGKEVRERNIKKGGLALMVKKRISQSPHRTSFFSLTSFWTIRFGIPVSDQGDVFEVDVSSDSQFQFSIFGK